MPTYGHQWETVVRRARKDYECEGDGRTKSPQHAEGCHRRILRGDEYVEYLGATAAYQSGSRHSIPCGVAFYCVDILDE